MGTPDVDRLELDGVGRAVGVVGLVGVVALALGLGMAASSEKFGDLPEIVCRIVIVGCSIGREADAGEALRVAEAGAFNEALSVSTGLVGVTTCHGLPLLALETLLELSDSRSCCCCCFFRSFWDTLKLPPALASASEGDDMADVGFFVVSARIPFISTLVCDDDALCHGVRIAGLPTA